MINSPDQSGVSSFMKVRQYVMELIGTSGCQPQILPSARKLAEIIGISHPTVLRAMQSLEKDGYVKKQKNGGAVTCPLNFDMHNSRIFAMIVEDGKVAYEIYYHYLVESVLGIRLTKQSQTIAVQKLYLNTAADLAHLYDQGHHSGLLLVGVKQPDLIAEIVKLRQNGVPAAALISQVDSVSSWAMRYDDLLAASLRKLFAENRRKIVVLKEPVFPEGDNFANIINTVCAEYNADPKKVIVLTGHIIPITERLNELLELGVRFDGIIGLRNFWPVYKALAKYQDMDSECRSVILEYSRRNDMNYSGYVINFQLKTAADELVTNLLMQVENPATPAVTKLIKYDFIHYQAGAVQVVFDSVNKTPALKN